MTLDLRAAIAARLAEPDAPKQAALCATVAPAWGVSPRDAAASLSRWLRGKQPTIPLHAIEAVLSALGGVVSFPPIGQRSGPLTPTEAAHRTPAST